MVPVVVVVVVISDLVVVGLLLEVLGVHGPALCHIVYRHVG